MKEQKQKAQATQVQNQQVSKAPVTVVPKLPEVAPVSIMKDSKFVFVRIPEETQAKIDFLVDIIDKEVGWFGIVEQEITDEGTEIYILQPELYIYPQIVTGSTVDTDDTDEAYDLWWIKHLSEGKRLMWHGHSHVNMTTFASGTDHQLRKQLNADGGTHIYTIHNKSGSVSLDVYEGETELNSCILHGEESISHEDIISQLSVVKYKPYSATTHLGDRYTRQTNYGASRYTQQQESSYQYGFSGFQQLLQEAERENEIEDIVAEVEREQLEFLKEERMPIETLEDVNADFICPICYQYQNHQWCFACQDWCVTVQHFAGQADMHDLAEARRIS